MTLQEFLNELKHKSINISLCYENGSFIYAATLGELIHWVHYQEFATLIVDMVTPTASQMYIYLEEE